MLVVSGADEAVVLFTGDPTQRRGPVPLTLDPGDEGRLDHLWAWSAVCPVNRVEPAELEAYSCPSAEASLVVRLRWPGSAPTPPAGVLLAAPPEAWAEIYEPLVPSWAADEEGIVRVPSGGGPLRLRFVGELLGSDWVDVPAGTGRMELELRPVVDRRVRLLGPDGETLAPAFLTLSRHGRLRDDFQARFRSDEVGRIDVSGLPPKTPLVIVASSKGLLPARLETTAAGLPEAIRLEGGCTLSGRVADDDGVGLVGVDVEAEGYAGSGTALLIRSEAETDESGRFRVGPLARAPIVLTLRAEGHARKSLQRYLGECETDYELGLIDLAQASSLAIRVVDDLGRPVVGADVRASSGERAASGEDGTAKLAGVAAREGLGLEVSAIRHLPWERSILAPLPESLTVELQRAAVVRGRLVDQDGGGLAGEAHVKRGSFSRRQGIGGDGVFTIDLEPESEYELRLRSATTRDALVRLPPIVKGEELDLGDVVAPAGWTVRGRLIREDTVESVHAARIWALRPESQAIVAWALGEQVSTTSDVEGAFVLSGLSFGLVTIRIEPAGLAPTAIVVAPPGEDQPQEVDLGTIELTEGAEVTVYGDLPDGAIARVDWKLEWREMDMLRGSVVDGKASVSHVPEGPAIVTVVDGHRQLCEEQVDVPVAGLLEIECAASRLRVQGVVSVAGRPRGPGVLTWISETMGDTLIINRQSSLGAGEARTFGGGRPEVAVLVASDGSFASDALAGGGWFVAWSPETGGNAASRRIELPADGELEIALDFAPHALSGQVVDEQGEPVQGARVIALDVGAAARTAEDGRFTLLDLEPGLRSVMASKEELRSATLEVLIENDRLPDPVVLRLDRQGDRDLEVRVHGDGLGTSGSFVFVEGDLGGLRILTTDRRGVGRSNLSHPMPSRIRAAAMAGGRLAFGPWSGTEEALAEGLDLQVERSGTLEVHAERDTDLSLTSPAGWDVAALYRHLGARLNVSPVEPLVLSGLPEGRYRVVVDGIERFADVTANDVTRIEFDD